MRKIAKCFEEVSVLKKTYTFIKPLALGAHKVSRNVPSSVTVSLQLVIVRQVSTLGTSLGVVHS